MISSPVEQTPKKFGDNKPTALVCPLLYENSHKEDKLKKRIQSAGTDHSEDYFELVQESGISPNYNPLKYMKMCETTSVGNNSSHVENNPKYYDQPWDLSYTQNHLEESFHQLMMNQSQMSKDCVTAFCIAAPQSVELKDLRSQEGYDKPWDLRPHKKDERGQEGYDKPWDLKPHSMDERPSDEYDVPWDKSARHIERELRAAQKKSIKIKDDISNKILMASKPIKSENINPNEEYDEPWDQKIRQIVTKVIQSKIQSKISAKSTFDLKSPLESQSWYHGMISRTQAEDILRFCKEGGYLVRTSESNHQDYSLSVKSSKGFMHMKITTGQGSSFILGQFSQPFQSIPQMIHHYTVNKLPIKGAEHISLVHAVPHECL